ncbi:Uncharacterized protein APZ42_025985 [Daphnia magna]|uniref:Uncharacterized protein n=1 Tax=Daphnia magna TaxID=35525 RepID=A0A162DBZ9_9CRUS|nr:Uncharacterized protein APZ42_025985 [Daphnia magna]
MVGATIFFRQVFFFIDQVDTHAIGIEHNAIILKLMRASVSLYFARLCDSDWPR